MRIFDPHIHMYARTTDDYEQMAVAGIEMIVEPSFWLGQPRTQPGTFFDYFEHIMGFEHDRAARHGIRQFVTLSMNPRESNNVELAKAVLRELPRYLDHPNVVGVGEIGFDRITPEEEESFRAQLALARERKLPVMIHTPHVDKKRGVEKSLEVLRDMRYDLNLIDMDHNIEDTTPVSKASGCWSGHTIYNVTKLTPERAANIILQHGIEKMMINSSADWGPSDPLSVPKTVLELKQRGMDAGQIQTLVWDNPLAFFSQSGRIR
jgi:predicted metal-dependent TIM-barrel fold hydrolase